MDKHAVPRESILKPINKSMLYQEKFLNTFRIWRNYARFFHIYNRFYYEFSKWTPTQTWDKNTQFSVPKITLLKIYILYNKYHQGT